MKETRWAPILMATLVPTVFASNIDGSWSAWPVGHMADAPYKTSFDFDANDSKLIGMAYLGHGTQVPLYEGKIDGDHFSFTVAGMKFEGTVGDKQMILTRDAGGQKVEMRGQKVDESMVVTPVSVDATAADVTGTWRAWFVCRLRDRPMFPEVTFDFKVEANGLTGSAHMGSWPGDASISDGRFEAGHFSFIATGRRPSSSGTPRFKFEGTIHGREMKVTIVELDVSGALEEAMDGKKLD